MKPSEELKAYIEAEIIPRYGAFDAAHRTDSRPYASPVSW